jgi:hypothetical protein
MALTALEKIQEIQARAEQEIRELRQQAISEVVRRLSEAKALVKDLEAQYTQLTGKNLKGETVDAPKAGRAAKADISGEQELVALLEKAPDKRLNRKGINDAGFNLKSALAVAKASPKVFGFAQNGPQGEVWLK